MDCFLIERIALLNIFHWVIISTNESTLKWNIIWWKEWLASDLFDKPFVHFFIFIIKILVQDVREQFHFRFAIAVSLFCTLAAVLLILIGVGIDHSSCKSSAVYKPPTFHSLYSLGTFVFAYSGHHVFPTIQHDMREPKEFTKSIVLGFIC